MKFKECGPSFGSSQFIDFKVAFWRWCFVIRAGAIAITAPILDRRNRIACLVDATLDLAAPQRVDRSWTRDHIGYTLAIGANQSAERVHVGIATYCFKERIQTRKDSCVKRRKLCLMNGGRSQNQKNQVAYGGRKSARCHRPGGLQNDLESQLRRI